MFSVDLLLNALIAGVLLGGFYAAVSLGLTVSFGQLNIVNIAHPAFVILGSYIAYMCNDLWGLDPILAGLIFIPVFFLIGAGAYRLYYESFERKDDEALRGLAFFFGVMFIIEVGLIMVYGVDFRTVQASYIGQSWKVGAVGMPTRMFVPFCVSIAMFTAVYLYMSRTFNGRAIKAVAQDRLALQLMGADPVKIKQLGFGISIGTAALAGALLIIIIPVEPSVGRLYIGQVFAIAVLAGLGSIPRHAGRWRRPRRRGEPGLDVLRPLLGARRGLRHSARGPRLPAAGAVRPMRMPAVKLSAFWICAAAVALIGVAVTIFDVFAINKFIFFAGYVVLQYVILATAWNIMGGYMGYVNFGTAGFFAVGAYSSVVLYNLFEAPLALMIPFSGVVCALLGLAMGYLTLRLRGVFFAIATLAMAIVLETLMINWDYVGGATGAYILRSREMAPFGDYVEYLFFVMLLLAIFAVAVARWIELSKAGRGFSAIRDDEIAAECAGVPTLRLKLIATTVSGFLMGVAGSPFALYVGFVEPSSAFNLVYAVNAIAMPMIGGATTWLGPLIGALLLGTVQQVATVTISSELNLLIVGVVLVFFVIVAPEGIVGLLRKWWRPRDDK